MVDIGYVDKGLCPRCHRAGFLFVHSMLEVDQSPQCYDCIRGFTIEGEMPPRIPLMSTEPVCAGCARPEYLDPELPSDNQTWQFTTGHLRDGTTEVVVHKNCVSSNYCDSCDTPYLNGHNRSWRSHTERMVSTHEIVVYTQIEGDTYCGNCADKFYEDNGGQDNYTCCGSCEDIIHRDNTYSFNGERYCEHCHDNNVYWCEDCDEQYWADDGHDCAEAEGVIHNYSYRPSPYFFGKGQYHLGFELEVEARNSSRYEGASMVQDILGSRAYMKDDGSLSDGFEIVTHPHTLSDYQTDFNWDFIPKLKREGFRSWNTDTCGLHVHVSRTAFGTGETPWGRSDRDQLILKRQAHELRFMKLIYDNQRQVERIAGRSGNQYATFSDKGKLVHKVKFGNQSSGRYSAINTENDATLEVRVFKGSLRKERVLSALEFVTASVEYTRDLKVTSKNQALSWLRFTAYVSENMETYPNLALIMSESFASDNNPNEN